MVDKEVSTEEPYHMVRSNAKRQPSYMPVEVAVYIDYRLILTLLVKSNMPVTTPSSQMIATVPYIQKYTRATAVGT